MGNTCCKCLKTKNNGSIEIFQNVRDCQPRRNDQSGQNGLSAQNGQDVQNGQNGQKGQSGRSEQNCRSGYIEQRDYCNSEIQDALQCSFAMLDNDPGNILIITVSSANGKSARVTEQPSNDGNGIGRQREIFKCCYSSNRRCLISGEMPAGNFIDCQNRHDRNFMYVINEWTTWAHSVSQIRYPNGTATGFRVGSRYIMTAFHVVKLIYQEIGTAEHYIEGIMHLKALEHRNVLCLFDYYKEDGFTNVKKYFFKSVVHFADEKSGTAVLELKDNCTDNPLPPPFELFNGLYAVSKFTLIGHNGGPMEYNEVHEVIDRDSETTHNDIKWVKKHSLEKTGYNYELLPNKVLLNKERILFHCKLSHGASGTPGIVVLNDRAIVVTMLLCGYPDWYYDQSVDRRIRSEWPREFCIEQGTDMLSVGKKMAASRPRLYRDIFCRNIPDPVLYEHRY